MQCTTDYTGHVFLHLEVSEVADLTASELLLVPFVFAFSPWFFCHSPEESRFVTDLSDCVSLAQDFEQLTLFLEVCLLLMEN